MDLFSVIADPTRRRMIDMMRDGEKPAGAFVAAFPGVTQPAISQHLKVLRDAGVVDVRAERQRRFYALRPNGLQAVFAWLEPHRPTAAEAPEPKPKRTRPRVGNAPALMLDLFG